MRFHVTPMDCGECPMDLWPAPTRRVLSRLANAARRRVKAALAARVSGSDAASGDTDAPVDEPDACVDGADAPWRAPTLPHVSATRPCVRRRRRARRRHVRERRRSVCAPLRCVLAPLGGADVMRDECSCASEGFANACTHGTRRRHSNVSAKRPA